MASSLSAADYLGILRGWPSSEDDVSGVYGSIMSEHFPGCCPTLVEEDTSVLPHCQSCGKAMLIPSVLLPCNHYVCNTCAPHYSSEMRCPVCGNIAKAAGLNEGVAKQIHSMMVKCSCCDEVMPLDLLQTHVEVCEKV